MLIKNKEIENVKVKFVGIEECTINFTIWGEVLTYIPKFEIEGRYKNVDFNHSFRIRSKDLCKIFSSSNNVYYFVEDEKTVLKLVKNIKDNINSYKIKRKIIKHFYECYNEKLKNEKNKIEKEDLLKELNLIECK